MNDDATSVYWFIAGLWLGFAVAAAAMLFVHGEARNEMVWTGLFMMLVSGLGLNVEAKRRR